MRKFTTAALFILLSVPLIAGAQTLTVADLQAKAAALLQQIAQMQAQLSGGTASGTASSAAASASQTCPALTRSLRFGSVGADVSQLQTYLLTSTDAYPNGKVTGYYGLLTQAAVQRWQAEFDVVSSGSPATTGWGAVGPKTIAAIEAQCSPDSSDDSSGSDSTGNTAANQGAGTTQYQYQSQNQTGNQTANANQPAISGTIQVTPISGTAPLTVSVQATLNTLSSCLSADYILNFGDGTPSIPIPVQQNNCQPVTQFFTHTFQAGGTYPIVLAAGGHRTYAIVTVAPAVATTTPIALPADSLVASIATGTAPLTVVFTGTVSSIAGYGCSSSCSDTIQFGDGGVGVVPLPTTQNTWQSYTISHTFATAGTYGASLLAATGTVEVGPIQINVSPAVTSSYSAYPTSGSAPLSVTFTGIVPGNSGYTINFGDGTVPVTAAGTTTTSLSQIVSQTHTYAAAGTYNAVLTSISGTILGTTTIIVNPTVSAAFSAAPVLGNAPMVVGFTGTVPGNNGYILSFGDGSAPSVLLPTTCPSGQTCSLPLSENVMVTHTYSTSGIFAATLTSAGSTIGNATISVNPAIVASFIATPTSGVAPLAVSFAGTSPGNFGYTLNYGDGSSPFVVSPVTITCPAGQSCSGPISQPVNVSHTYAASGTYHATLTSNNATLGTVTVTPTDAPANSSYGIIQVYSNVGNNPFAASVFLSLPCAAYQVDWGDSTAITTQTASCTSGGMTLVASHLYAATSTYTIRLNNGSGVQQASAQLIISK